MRQEDWDREQMERAERDDYERQMDRRSLIDEVAARIEAGDTPEGIVDMIISRLTPADDAECPLCGMMVRGTGVEPVAHTRRLCP